MREIRTSGSEGGARSIPCPYPYQALARRPEGGWFSGAFGFADAFRRACASLGFRLRCASGRQAGPVAARPVTPRDARTP